MSKGCGKAVPPLPHRRSGPTPCITPASCLVAHAYGRCNFHDADRRYKACATVSRTTPALHSLPVSSSKVKGMMGCRPCHGYTLNGSVIPNAGGICHVFWCMWLKITMGVYVSTYPVSKLLMPLQLWCDVRPACPDSFRQVRCKSWDYTNACTRV